MITTDEELGGRNGVKFLLKQGYKSKVCLLPDGGSGWKLIKASKGVLHLLVKSKGKSAHSSKPWLGENAIDQLVDFLELLKKQISRDLRNKETRSRFYNTASVTKISGGNIINQLPDTAEALVDIRFVPELKKTRLKKALSDIKKKFKRISVKEIMYSDGFHVDVDNAYAKIFSRIAFDKFKTKTPWDVTHGSSDARFFAKKNIPIIVTRPKGGGHHSENEWIDVKDLEKFYVVIKEFVKNVGKI